MEVRISSKVNSAQYKTHFPANASKQLFFHLDDLHEEIYNFLPLLIPKAIKHLLPPYIIWRESIEEVCIRQSGNYQSEVINSVSSDRLHLVVISDTKILHIHMFPCKNDIQGVNSEVRYFNLIWIFLFIRLVFPFVIIGFLIIKLPREQLCHALLVIWFQQQNVGLGVFYCSFLVNLNTLKVVLKEWNQQDVRCAHFLVKLS